MNGFTLRLVGWTLVLAAVAFLALALFYFRRRRRAVLDAYQNRYGSKLFFSVHPNFKETASSDAPAEGEPDIPKWNPEKQKERAEKLNRLQQSWESRREVENWDVYGDISPANWDAYVTKMNEDITEWENVPKENVPAEDVPEDFKAFSLDEFPYLLLDRQNALISSGENSDVYLAAHKRTGKTVVIKVGKALKENKKQLQDIVFALRDLRHPMIPILYDFYSNDALDASYTVMEYVDGQTLEEALKRKKDGDGQTLEEALLVNQSQCLNWTYDLLDALEYLHSKGIVHGDMRPSNIILSHDGSLSRLIDFSKAIATLDGDADPRQDLYQLGAMMFRFLTAQDLSTLQTPEAREAALRKQGVSEPLIGVILKATEDDAEKRYQSATEMLSALRIMILKGEEVRSHDMLMRGAYALSALAFVCGVPCAYYGQSVLICENTILSETRQAVEEFDGGDYSQALKRASDAVSAANRLPSVSGKVKAETERVLAKVLGVYDLSPGYKPQASVNGDMSFGRPLKAAVSPDGRRLSVMFVNNSGGEPVFCLRFFDAQSGKELAQAVPTYPSALSGFEFLDERILFYAGEETLTVCSLPEAPPDDDNDELPAVVTLDTGAPGKAVTRIAISGDGSVAAAVADDEKGAFLYRLVRDGNAVRLEKETYLSFGGRVQSGSASDDFTDPLDNLFALDEHGERLALSFSDGSLHIADVSDFLLLDQAEIYTEIPLPSNSYQHFEGGFCGNFFLYAASTKSLIPDSITSYAQVIRTDTTKSVASMTWETPLRAHACVNREAAYLTVANSLLRADFSSETWETVADGANITLLRHDAGRVLIVTENDTASVYDETEGKFTLSVGTPYHIAALAGDTLVLAHQDRPTLSVLRWQSQEPTLTYPADFEHLSAAMQSDRSSAILYRSRECMVVERDNPDKLHYRVFEDFGDMLKQGYQREPDGDKLVNVYPHRIDYYDAKTATLSRSEEAETAPNSPDAFTMGQYSVEARLNDSIRIRNVSKGKDILTLNQEMFKNAFLHGENLIVSILSMDGTQYSVLLNPEGETLAELPNLCDVLPDGTPIFDYNRGELFSGLLYSTDELLRLASNGRTEQK